jgi:hypothetical protein
MVVVYGIGSFADGFVGFAGADVLYIDACFVSLGGGIGK